MRKIFILLFLVPALSALGQPAGYYDPANGLTGETLRTALRNIIRAHTELTYTPGLWNAYYTTDIKPNGKLWDVYSDRPGGSPAYEYTLGSDQCGSVTPSSENSCYNREHTWPQSKFGSNAPMQTDLFIVYPTDYFVNYTRGDVPYGKVTTAIKTFTNGSKIGSNVYPGAPAGSCYEPIDSFKGDLARNYFYITTCYKNDSAVFTTWEMATRSRLKSWAINMLMEWHHMDPVSKKEIDRNNAVYALQSNRNPFIDHPEYADCIWGTGCTWLNTPQTALAQEAVSLYPNPASQIVTINRETSATIDHALVKVVNISGETLYTTTPSGQETISFSVQGWAKGVYFVHWTAAAGSQVMKLVVQ